MTGTATTTMKETTTIRLIFVDRDRRERPVYRAKNGRLYVDVDPRRDRAPKICTKYRNAFDGEPDTPVRDNVRFEFVPSRDVWSF